MAKTGKLDKEEMGYIAENYLYKTDKDIAAHLDRAESTVKRYRKSLDLKKESGRPSELKRNRPVAVSPNESFTEDERRAFFKGRLTNSLFYSTLKQQFTDEEIKYYLEEYGSLCVQFEDIVATEQRQIDEFIKAEILGNRILRNIRITEDEFKKITKEIEEFRVTNPSIATDEQAQERDSQLTMLARILGGQSEAMAINYQKNVDTKNKLLEHLNSRRVDRLDQIKRSGTTFVGMVEAFQKRELREKEGRHLELVRLAKEKKKNEWRQVSQFPDGQKDCILLDEFSEQVEQNEVVMEGSKLFNKYIKENGKRVLIIENNIQKAIFLSQKLKDNQLTTVKNSTDAIEELKNNDFHFICLGNDSVEFALHSMNNDMCRASDFIIHADNMDVSDKILMELNGKRNIERYPFEELVRDSNA